MTNPLPPARKLENELPKFWVSKIKTAFCWLDADDDGYITEKDFETCGKELVKLFPGISQEQKDMLVSKNSMWNDIFGAKGKGQDYKVTRDMYIERIFEIASQEGGEALLRKEWDKIFTVMDINKNGKISKTEHRLFFNSYKTDPIGATVSFTAIDEDMDGTITRDEFVNAAVEFFLNFSDETRRSKHFFGPLKF